MVKRWDCTMGATVRETAAGEFVTYEDYATLEAENAKLRAELERWAVDGWPLLERPAKVGAGTFAAGLSARFVVEAAYRQHEYATEPPFTDEQIKALAKTFAAPSAPKADDPVKVQLLEALEDLVRVNEQHNSAIQRVTGTPVGWKDDYLNHARAAIAAPRQPEGEAISRERVQAEADAFFDWPTTDKSSVTTTSCLIFARCIAGMVAAERDATIAELREECEHLKACQENAMLHMTGLVAERDTLRQQLADSDAALRESRANDQASMGHLADMRQQRDKLAGLLRGFSADAKSGDYPIESVVEHHVNRIDAALAEVNK